MHAAPLVSLIGPTGMPRLPFLRHMIRYARRQTYENWELVLLSDSDDVPLRLELGHDPRIRYFGAPPFKTLGDKRNAAVELARGSVLAVWDDDDWNAPERLAVSVETMQRTGADFVAQSGGYQHQLGTEHGTLYKDPTRLPHSFVFGSALFTKELWTRVGGFPSLPISEDVAFVRRAHELGAKVAPILRDDLYVVINHGGNACGRSSYVSDPTWDRPEDPEAVFRILGDDAALYRDPAKLAAEWRRYREGR